MTKTDAPTAILPRLADPTATATIDLGPCRCPNTPHDRDSAQIRTEIGDGEAKSVRVAGWGSTGMEYYDWEVANDKAIALATSSWTLVDKDGDPVPIDRQTVKLLDEGTRLALLEPINAAFVAQHGGPLPNASGAPSPGSSPESASPTPTTT